MNHPTKHIICLWAVLFAGVLASGLFAAEGPNSLDLDGREVIVRLYPDCYANPQAYELIGVRVANHRVNFNFGDLDNATVAILGIDQKDELIRRWLGHFGYGWSYMPGLDFVLPRKAASCDKQSLCWTLLDSLGNPISKATVEIYIVARQRRLLVERVSTDEQGRMRIPFCVGIGAATLKGLGFHNGRPAFVVTHPDYGTAEVRPHGCGCPHICYIPLVPMGSEADSRSAAGVVVDANGNPVSGAWVYGKALYPPGGARVDIYHCQSCGVRTDSNGQFRLYLPFEDIEFSIGYLIPPKTKYRIKIEPPKKLGLAGLETEVDNSEQALIVLDEGYFHRFVFEDDEWPITDLRKLCRFVVTIKRQGKPDLTVKYEDWKSGGVFPMGLYEAKTCRFGGYKFQPIQVTADVPEQLVFKVSPKQRLYYGQVVDDQTDEPVAGTFVVDFIRRFEGIDLAGLKAGQWDALHKLPPAVSVLEKPSNKALGPVCEQYLFRQLVRTDANGWFEIALPAERDVESLMIFEQNYLSVKVPLNLAEPDQYGSMQLPVTRLFPAARFAFEPWVEDPNRGSMVHILRQWFINSNCPEWAKKLQTITEKEPEVSSRIGFSIDCEKRPWSFYVPAGVKLLIKLRIWYNNQWSPPVFAETGELGRGEVLDIGKDGLKPAQTVFVEVVGSASQPVEGIPVRAYDRYRQIVSNTDANGIAIFELARNSKGEFVVEYNAGGDANEPHLREAMPYEITGPEDANTVFTLRVSDEIFYHLFK